MSPRILRKRIVVPVLAAIIIIGLIVYYLTLPPPPPQVLRVGIGIDADTLDPAGQTTTLVMNMIEHVYEGLLAIDKEGRLVPNLATSYEVAPDGTSITFSIRKGVRFHDGTPLNASAVKFALDRILDPKVKVPLRKAYFAWLNRTEVVGEFTVRLHLNYPYAPALYTLATPIAGIVSPTAVQVLGEKIVEQPVGTGPFKFKEWIKGDRIELVRNEDYWGKKPTLDKIVFKVVPEAATRVAMLLAGDLDAIVHPPAVEVPRLEEDPDFVVEKGGSLRVIMMYMDNRIPPFNDVRVRRAFSHAIDKEAITKKILHGLGKVIDSPVPPACFGYAPTGVYEFDPEKAKKLLAEAGYPEGLKLKLHSPVGRYLMDKEVAEAVAAYLRDVGVDVEILVYDWPTYVGMVLKSHEVPVGFGLIGWGPIVPDADFHLYGFYHSMEHRPRGLSLTFYSNPRFDELTGRARRTMDPAERLECYREAQKILFDEAGALWLYMEVYPIVWSKQVKGIEVLPFEWFRVSYAQIE